MSQPDYSLAKTPLFEHQKVGVEFLLRKPSAALFDEMGSGKSAQVIFTACHLFTTQTIDTVVVLAPAVVVHGWANLAYGEIVRHVWAPCWIGRFSATHTKLLPYTPETRARLYWVVTNYEFVRGEHRLKALMSQLRGRRTLVVADEASFIKSHTAAQTRASIQIRTVAQRAVILNGTPIGNNVLDLYSQFQFLDPRILNYKNYFHMRAVHCNMGGWNKKQIVSYKNLPVLVNKVKPYALRRLKKDCLDLPEKLYTTQTATLTPQNWRHYIQMRDRMVTEIKAVGVVMTLHSIVKIMRLAQMTCGFIGGVEDEEPGEVHEIGTEKLEAFQAWLQLRVGEQPDFRCVVWTRFRAEQARLATFLPQWGAHCRRIYGGQPAAERAEAIREFTEGTSKGVQVLLGQPQAGGFGLNLVTASNAVYLSNDYSLLTRLQSEDRLHRPGQRNNVLYTDFLATGPQGQQTIDHIIYNALRRKEDFARWTTDHWVEKLHEEQPPSLEELRREFDLVF